MDVLDLPDVAAWESWLETHHHERSEVWLRIAKRRSGLATLGISDAGDGALCFGWIDGQRRSLDAVSFLQRYSQRRPRSTWSQVNVARVDALTAAGRMRPAGLAEVAAARADGRWAGAYEPQRTATVPRDLAAALDGDVAARTAFADLGRSARYALILPILRAGTPRARETALVRTIARLGAAQPHAVGHDRRPARLPRCGLIGETVRPRLPDPPPAHGFGE